MQTTFLKSLREIYESVTGPLSDGPATDILLVALAGAVAKAHERWPNFAVHEEALVQRVAAIAGAEPGASARISQIEIADLLLAVAALAQEKPAVETLAKTIREAVRPVLLRRFGTNTTLVEEAAQHTQMKVLFGEDASRGPRLARYDARGPLTAWVRMVAVRVALDRVADVAPADIDSSLIQATLLSSDDPELRVILSRYAPLISNALKKSVTLLTDRERTLLRWSLVDGLSIDEIGTIYGCHRATASRWINAARDSLIAHAESEFCGLAKAAPSDFHSLLRMVPGYMQASLEHLLVDQTPSESAT